MNTKIILFCSLLAALNGQAFAAYKCESNGTVAYSDQPCPGGTVINTNQNPPAAADVKAAQKQLAQEKKKLKQLENARRKEEARAFKEQLRAERQEAAQRKKCAAMAQRTQWAEEDARKAQQPKSIDAAKLKAQRMKAKYQLECAR